MDLFHALKSGLNAAVKGPEPSHYAAGGLTVSCTHCKNDTFYTHEALLATTTGSFMKMEWLGDSGTALICANCGLIQWFAEEPEKLTQ